MPLKLESKMMSVEKARELIGNPAKWELRHMKRALSIMNLLNTSEENQRLEAVTVLLQN